MPKRKETTQGDVATVVVGCTNLLRQQGVELYPTAEAYLKRQVAKAARRYQMTPEDTAVCTTVWLASATKDRDIEWPKDVAVIAEATVAEPVLEAPKIAAGKARVRVADLVQGWTDIVEMPPLNCPPHRCMKLSILDRRSDVAQALPALRGVVLGKEN